MTNDETPNGEISTARVFVLRHSSFQRYRFNNLQLA